MDEVHPHWGGQSTLIPFRNIFTKHPESCWTKYLGTWPAKWTIKLNSTQDKIEFVFTKIPLAAVENGLWGTGVEAGDQGGVGVAPQTRMTGSWTRAGSGGKATKWMESRFFVFVFVFIKIKLTYNIMFSFRCI